MTKTVSKVVTIAASAVLLSTAAQAATFTTYSDRATFEAALSGEKTEQFNGVTRDESFNGSSYDVGDFSLFSTGNMGNFIDNPPLEADTIPVGDGALATFYLSNSIAGMTFDSPTYSLGFDFAGLGSGVGTTSISVLMQQVFTNADIADSGFFGVISDMAFSEMRFSTTARGDMFSIDNVTYGGQISAVPVPASLPLLAFGLGALGFWRRRQSA